MNAMVISYSLTGNNETLAASLAEALGVNHTRLTEPKTRTMGKIIMDTIFHRTPKIVMPDEQFEAYDLVLFVGPVWMGQIASPFRACFTQLRSKIGKYAFISICGGADGPNPKIADELTQRLGKEPASLIELYIADLLPSEPQPVRKDTMAYRITDADVKHLTGIIVATLAETLVL